jgi:hypothetical protein
MAACVHHYASNQSQEVPANGHILGVIRLPGIAFFPDGSIGTSLVIGTYDFYAGASTGGGYYTVTFTDGSELWMKWTGDNKVITPGKTRVKGRGHRDRDRRQRPICGCERRRDLRD